MFNCSAGCIELTVMQSIIHAATESTLGRSIHHEMDSKKKKAHGWRRNVRGLGRQNPNVYHTPIPSRPEQVSRTPWRQNMPLGPHSDATLTSTGERYSNRGRMLRTICQHQVCCGRTLQSIVLVSFARSCLRLLC